MSKFVITNKNGEYRFNLKAGNGEIILRSEGYTSKAACINGIDSVKTNAVNDIRYEKKTAKDNSHYFNLKSGNGQVIGTSEMYQTTSGRDNGIESVKKNAPAAEIEELVA